MKSNRETWQGPADNRSFVLVGPRIYMIPAAGVIPRKYNRRKHCINSLLDHSLETAEIAEEPTQFDKRMTWNARV